MITPKAVEEQFRRLRAKGAFLVSAAWDGHKVTDVEILSEKGAPARIASVWPDPAVLAENREVPFRLGGGIIEFATRPGETYRILPRGGRDAVGWTIQPQTGIVSALLAFPHLGPIA